MVKRRIPWPSLVRPDWRSRYPSFHYVTPNSDPLSHFETSMISSNFMRTIARYQGLFGQVLVYLSPVGSFHANFDSSVVRTNVELGRAREGATVMRGRTLTNVSRSRLVNICLFRRVKIVGSTMTEFELLKGDDDPIPVPPTFDRSVRDESRLLEDLMKNSPCWSWCECGCIRSCDTMVWPLVSHSSHGAVTDLSHLNLRISLSVHHSQLLLNALIQEVRFNMFLPQLLIIECTLAYKGLLPS